MVLNSTFPHLAAKKRKAPAFLHAQRLFFHGLRPADVRSMAQYKLGEQCLNFVRMQIIGLHALVELYHAHKHVLAQAFQGILRCGLSALVTVEAECNATLWSDSLNNEPFLCF